jgi:hypothetical protein
MPLRFETAQLRKNNRIRPFAFHSRSFVRLLILVRCQRRSASHAALHHTAPPKPATASQATTSPSPVSSFCPPPPVTAPAPTFRPPSSPGLLPCPGLPAPPDLVALSTAAQMHSVCGACVPAPALVACGGARSGACGGRQAWPWGGSCVLLLLWSDACTR